jgi:WD40 repeat protein
VWDLAFLQGGRSIAASSQEGTVWLWPLAAAPGHRGEIEIRREIETPGLWGIAADPDSNFVAAAGWEGLWLVSSDRASPRRLADFGFSPATAVSPSGRLAAAGAMRGDQTVLSVWDLESGRARVLETLDFEGLYGPPMDVHFLSEARLLVSRDGSLRLWDLGTGDSHLLIEEAVERFDVSPDGRQLVTWSWGFKPADRPAVVYNLEDGVSRELASHGTKVTSVAFDPSGTIVATSSWDGIVRVGPVTGEPPHLLLGHEGMAQSVAVSPDGEWIASGGRDDGTVRVWPMPKGQPFHTLPHDELLDRLRGMTNIRVVKDQESATGYRLELEPFPGWKATPVW